MTRSPGGCPSNGVIAMRHREIGGELGKEPLGEKKRGDAATLRSTRKTAGGGKGGKGVL